MIGPGTMPVRVEVLDTSVRVAAVERPRPTRTDVVRAPTPVPAAPAPEPTAWYGVLVATLSDAGRAEHLRSRIALKFPETRVHPVSVGASRYYRVDLGPFPSRGVAQARAESVTRYGYPAVITEADAP